MLNSKPSVFPAEIAQQPHHVAIGLGGNLGDVLKEFRRALWALEKQGCALLAVSSAYETRALCSPDGEQNMPNFWNTVALVEWQQSPEELLNILQNLEAAAGRVQLKKDQQKGWHSRPLDLDILLMGKRIIASGPALVPHPRMLDRIFVLAPLNDVAPHWEILGLEQSGLYVRDALERSRPEHQDMLLSQRQDWFAAEIGEYQSATNK